MRPEMKALIEKMKEEVGEESWEELIPSVGWTLGRIIESIVEDVATEAWDLGYLRGEMLAYNACSYMEHENNRMFSRKRYSEIRRELLKVHKNLYSNPYTVEEDN